MPGDDFYNLLNGGAESAGFNPETPDYASMLGYGAPAQATEAAPSSNPVTSPEQVPVGDETQAVTSSPNPSISAPISPKSQSVAVGSKVGVQGYSPGANAAIQAGPKKGVEGALARDQANIEASYAPMVADEHAATQQAVAAELKGSQIESQKIAATSEAKQKIAAANTDFMVKEKAAMDNARAEADATQAQYRAALADYAAAKINPSQLWENGGAGGQASMIITAFAHDFLGAKGIQTSGLESINKAIQNNISAQLENMHKKQDVAAGFKSLWEMQRAQSATDGEARQRMNGFYLAALSNGIEAQLGSYDSELALNKGQAAKAALMKEQVKNDLLVRQHIDTAANQRATNRVHMYAAELGASSAKYTADAHIKAAQITADAKNKTSPLEGVIFDTSKSGGNVAVRRFLPDVKPEERNKLREQTAKTLDTAKNVEHLIELQDQIDAVPPTDVAAVKKLQSEARRTAELVRNVTRMGIIYDNSGKQINEQEVKLYDEIVARKDWWVNGDNVRSLGNLTKMMLDKNDAVMGAVSTQIVPGDPAYGISSGTKGFDEGNRTLSDIQSAPGAGKPQQGEADKYREWANAPNAYKAYNVDDLPDSGPGSKPAVKKDWAQFRQDQPPLAPSGLRDEERRKDGALDFTGNNPDNPDRAFIQIERLADLAIGGDTKAREIIETYAKGRPSSDEKDGGLLAAYAQWELANKLQAQ